MKNETVLGIDMGGTNIRAGLVNGGSLSSVISQRVNAKGTAEEILHDLFNFIDRLINNEVKTIGIGVPGLTIEGIAYNVFNIPSWKEVALQQLLEQRYNLPVLINNDANCFALGEFYFGKGQGYDSMIGLTVGTGLGSGIIISKKLYTGKNGGAGEFGMIDYLDKCYEYYASGQFFQNVYGTDGEIVFKKALEGKPDALKMYSELGKHPGNAVKMILYAFDINLIILGGSVSQAYPFFSKTMWQQIQSFEFKRTQASLRIEVSELDNSAVLGAAALHYDVV